MKEPDLTLLLMHMLTTKINVTFILTVTWYVSLILSHISVSVSCGATFTRNSAQARPGISLLCFHVFCHVMDKNVVSDYIRLAGLVVSLGRWHIYTVMLGVSMLNTPPMTAAVVVLVRTRCASVNTYTKLYIRTVDPKMDQYFGKRLKS